MQQTAEKQMIRSYLNNLRILLDEAYTDGIRVAVPTDIQPNGTVAGIFLSDGNERFQFLINESEIRFKLSKDKANLDSYTVGFLSISPTIGVEFQGNDAYSSGFLEGWSRMDARKRKAPQCKIGIACKSGCISKQDECRVSLKSPITQKQVKTVIDAGKTISAIGGSDLILPFMGAGAIALVSFSVGVSVGSYLGATAATAPPPPRTVEPEPTKTKRTKKAAQEFSEEMPDYWGEPKPVKPKVPESEMPVIENPFGTPPAAPTPKVAEPPDMTPLEEFMESESPAPPTRKAGTFAQVNPAEIAFDPQRFQYKMLGSQTKTGEVGSLSGVKKWDPDLGGVIQVWEDPADGKTYVVNGHNRLALANRLGAESVAVRYIDAKDPAEARAVGALTNIAEGRGTALDAAKFFRDTGLSKQDLESRGIPTREKIAQDGVALSQLDGTLFRQTIDGKIPVERAALIGGSGLDKTRQRELFKMVESRKNVTNDVLSGLIDGVKAAEVSVQEQFDLFGSSEVAVSNALERAEMQAAIKKRLSREKKLFGVVSKQRNAEDLAEAGNRINVEGSQAVSRDASQAMAVFDQLKNQSGGISNLLNEASNGIRNGGDRDKIEAKLYKDIVTMIKSGKF